jgi:hypothetical protein
VSFGRRGVDVKIDFRLARAFRQVRDKVFLKAILSGLERSVGVGFKAVGAN